MPAPSVDPTFQFYVYDTNVTYQYAVRETTPRNVTVMVSVSDDEDWGAGTLSSVKALTFEVGVCLQGPLLLL